MKGTVSTTTPPTFFRLAGHPLRWQLLSELAYSDRQVRELCQLLGQPQNLVSYHLGRLRTVRLVSARRSSADGRDAYYSVDLARCGEQLGVAGGLLHPGLRLVPPPIEDRSGGRRSPRVLFLCTGNSARSQMAEGLVQHLSHAAVEAYSAGSHPKTLHSQAVRVMRTRGIDLRGRRAKHLQEFATQQFDFVITLCDCVREVCPEFPGYPRTIHWSIADPALDGPAAFERTAAELEMRVSFLLHVIREKEVKPDGTGYRYRQRPLHGG
jgi:ArsR family transcriptional regulator, arsenate/arsenite/antimonite-responsive transcriptional repressor / arsenate reductase (thioredoxin)